MNKPRDHTVDETVSRQTVSRSFGGDPIIDTDLLDLLLRADGPQGVEALALRLKKTPRMILDQLDRLRQAGCHIETHPQHGMTLVCSGLAAWADYLRRSNGTATGRMIEVYAQTTSTQDAARRILASCGTVADRAVAVADMQTAGRGRLGRRWVAPPGTAVTFTRICVLKAGQQSVDRLTLATAVGVTQAIESLIHPVGVQIKWPNDLMINGKKVAGILVETFAHAPKRFAAAIGVGINVTLKPQDLPAHPPGLRDRVTSLSRFGQHVDRLLVLSEAIRRIDDALDQADSPPLLDYWRRRCPLLSQRLRLSHRGQIVCGRVIDLDPSAGLIVHTDSGNVLHLPAATTTIL